MEIQTKQQQKAQYHALEAEKVRNKIRKDTGERRDKLEKELRYHMFSEWKAIHEVPYMGILNISVGQRGAIRQAVFTGLKVRDGAVGIVVHRIKNDGNMSRNPEPHYNIRTWKYTGEVFTHPK